MTILGVGGLELVLIFVLIILVLGPERAPQAARALGRQWRRWTTSEWWSGMSQFAYSVRNLPQTLTKLAEIEDLQAQLSEDMKTVQQVQQEIQDVAKPAQEALSGKSIREAVSGLETDLKGSLTPHQPAAASNGGQPNSAVSQEAPEPAGTTAVATSETPRPETLEPAGTTAAAAPEASGLAAPEPGPADQKPATSAHDITVYMDRLPDLFDRLEQLEMQYAQILEQMVAMQGNNEMEGQNGPTVVED